MSYRGQQHNEIFALATKNRPNSSYRYLSVIYLLTANKRLWNRSKKAVFSNSVDFSEINCAGLEPETYTLLTTAKDFDNDDGNLTVADLANKEIISAKLFSIICTAISICRYGLNYHDKNNMISK